MNTERFIGLAVVLLGLLVLFILIPYGIVTPESINIISLSPDFWPRIISAIIVLTGFIMLISSINIKKVDDSESLDLKGIKKLLVVILCLFGFYFSIPSLGMVVPGILLIFILMTFAGERAWLRMCAISIAIPLCLFFFFTSIANIPIPLGIFESLRG